MSIEPEGWHMDTGPPSWDADAKPGREPVLCILAMDALENAAQSCDISEAALHQIFDAAPADDRTPSCPETECRTARCQWLRATRR